MYARALGIGSVPPGAYVMGVVARSRQASDATLVILNAGVTPQKKS